MEGPSRTPARPVPEELCLELTVLFHRQDLLYPAPEGCGGDHELPSQGLKLTESLFPVDLSGPDLLPEGLDLLGNRRHVPFLDRFQFLELRELVLAKPQCLPIFQNGIQRATGIGSRSPTPEPRAPLGLNGGNACRQQECQHKYFSPDLHRSLPLFKQRRGKLFPATWFLFLPRTMPAWRRREGSSIHDPFPASTLWMPGVPIR